ncbi:MAG: response regulator transcription factor [Chitinophagaceae bacterium]|nr:response regulator transcription factor [Chitinophagaceae bacterium]
MKTFLIVDDHEIVRAGIKQVLAELYFPCTVHEAYDEQSAISLMKNNKYDLTLLDVQLPDTNTLGLLEYIKINMPETRVVIFSMGAENIYAKRFLKAGAMSYISKKSGLEELRKGIDMALNNRRYISDTLTNILFSDFESQTPENPFEKLSDRETQISQLLIQGESLSEIGNRLHLSLSTVGTHKARIFDKLGIQNLPQLIEMNRLYNL